MRGVDTASPERAYSSKPNIVVPGGTVQSAQVSDRAVEQIVAQGTLIGDPKRLPSPAGAAPTVVAVGASVSDTSPRYVDIPAGTLVGDSLLLFVEAPQDVWINVEGWVEVPFSPGTPSAATHLHVFWARYRGGLKRPQIVGNGVFGTMNHFVAAMIVVRGARNADNPFNNHADSSDAVSNTSATVTGVTTSTDKCLMLYGIASDTAGTFSAWANAALTGVTELIDVNTATGNAGSLGVASGVKQVAGAAGNMTATLSVAGVKGMFCIAVSPGSDNQVPQDLPSASVQGSLDGFTEPQIERSVVLIPRALPGP